ncbi:MAG: ketosteroid isomerase family protein [Cyanobacteria bacterium J06649_4]
MDLPQPVQAYFDTLNQKAFEQTAQLFTEEGALVPPFESGIVGRDAIATYLTKEAKDLTVIPLQIEPTVDTEEKDGACAPDTVPRLLTVTGKVKTSLFTVNAAWHFALGPANKIERVQIKLLAKLTQLMTMKR